MPVGDLSLEGMPENSLMDHVTPSNRKEQTRRVAESLKRQLGPICPLLAAPDLGQRDYERRHTCVIAVDASMFFLRFHFVTMLAVCAGGWIMCDIPRRGVGRARSARSPP
jgi:hypothetical protein